MSFDDAFIEQLGTSRRWRAFSVIVLRLLGLGRPVQIIETGCARKAGNWAGDGQSTVVWDWVIGKVGGHAMSIDLDPEHCATARSLAPRVEVICGDSIWNLRGAHQVEFADLVYLDAYDVTDDYRSSLHHMGELAAIYEQLPSGCMIAVDDCISPTRGKHLLVKHFFESIGVKPLVDSYVCVWVKP